MKKSKIPNSKNLLKFRRYRERSLSQITKDLLQIIQAKEKVFTFRTAVVKMKHQ